MDIDDEDTNNELEVITENTDSESRHNATIGGDSHWGNFFQWANVRAVSFVFGTHAFVQCKNAEDVQLQEWVLQCYDQKILHYNVFLLAKAL